MDETKSVLTDDSAPEQGAVNTTEQNISGDGQSVDQKPVDKNTDNKGVGDQKSAVPEKYDLKLPEQSMLTDDDLADIAEEARSLGLDQTNAQKLVESRNKDRAAFLESMRLAHQEKVVSWREALTRDPEIAGKDGTEFSANIARAKLVLAKYGTPELRKHMDETGFGNHPEVVKFFVRLGKAMREDVFHTGENRMTPNVTDLEALRASKFYKS